MALGLPHIPRLVGVPTLTVSAAPWSQAAWSVSPTAVICAVLQAGRARYNWCFFSAEDLLFRPGAADHGSGTAGEMALALEEHAAPTLWLVGEVDAALREAVQTNPRVTAMDAVSGQRRAGELARLAAIYLAEGIEESVDSIQPLYLRAP
jgi:tRNA A37 threonylcarbamoyladenosine modification protein TsaB